jgi:four helix bundle protein
MSYRDLEIWQLARGLTTDIHRMTIRDLPKFEMYEEASQIRRAMKSTRSNIVEGYGRRRYKQEFIRFLTFALSSNDETTDHLEMLYETESLKNDALYQELHRRLNTLGRKLNNFLQSVESGHRS